MIEHELHTAERIKTVNTRNGIKHIYKLQFTEQGKKAEEAWLSEKQAGTLECALDRTPKGYSNKNVRLIASFNERGYYAWTSVRGASK